MSSQQLDEEAIFHVAREILNSETRSRYLGQVCAGDQQLRERVEALLDVHEKEAEFLKSSPEAVPTVDHTPITESPGQQIGRFKLLQQIGEGGFGVVYMAEQTRPVRRKVALKIIKPGMDSNAVIARFEAERQALALMDHPNIARVLDGGASASGRPYFVMDLVKGIPITTYCDDNKLRTRERLQLFVDVCQAVQHAHQKGIIHRDLKPSNIMVTLHDGQPVVKVIDFGVSKAINQQLTEKTLFTAYGQMIGTPQYMSPEQAEMSGLDVDTRSDVYSLGVLLFELLTGTTPLDAEQLRTAGYAEIQRLIKETEPPKPSTRLSTSGDQLTHIAEHRDMSPDRLHKEIKGDLDWIVMKSLDKERSRRYESASSLARDVSNYLTNEAIEARPPTLGYRASKYFKRNRVPIAVAALLIGTLTGGLAGTVSQARRATQQAILADRTIKDMHGLLVERAFLQSISGEFKEAETTVQLMTQAKVPAEWRYTVLGSIDFHRGRPKEALIHLQRAVDINPDNVSAQALLSFTYVFTGEWDKWSEVAETLQRAEPGREYPVFDELFLGYAHFYIDYEMAANRIGAVVDEHPSWLVPRVLLATAWAHQARQVESENLARKAICGVAVADFMPRDNPFVLLMNLFTYGTALDLKELLEEGEVDDAEAKGNAAAEALTEFPAYAIGSLIRAWHCDTVDNPVGLAAAHEDLVNFGYGFQLDGPLANWAMAEQYDKILAMKDKGPNAEIAKAFVYAMKDDADKAMHIYDELKKEHTSWYVRNLAIEIPLLVGDTERAKQDATQWLTDSTGLAKEHEQERLTRVAERPTALSGDRLAEFESHFLSGVTAIGRREWDGAISSFEKALAVGRIGNRFFWARVFMKHAQTQLGTNTVSDAAFREGGNDD